MLALLGWKCRADLTREHEKNTAVKDWETVKETMFDEMEPVEDLMTAIKTPMNLAESTSINRAANSVNIAVGTQIRINDGYVLTVKESVVELSHTEDYDPYDQEAYLKAELTQGKIFEIPTKEMEELEDSFYQAKDAYMKLYRESRQVGKPLVLQNYILGNGRMYEVLNRLGNLRERVE